MNRSLIAISFALASSAAIGQQTPAIHPQTPEIKVPPAVTIQGPPPPENLVGGQPLGVAEAIRLALRYQTDLTIAKGNVQVAAGQAKAAAAALGPQLTLTAGAADQEVFRGTAQVGTNSFTGGVNASQLLFDFGKTRTQVRQLQALEGASRLTLDATAQDIAYQTAVAFFNLSQSLENVSISEENLANRQRQLDEARARVGVGLGSPGDEVRAKTSLADSVSDLEAARTSALTAQIQLNLQMGIDPRTPVIPAKDPKVALANSETDLEKLVQTAIRQRPEIRAAEQRVLAASLGVSAARLTSAPRLTLVAGVNGRGANDPLESQTGSIGLNLTWLFGDSGLTAGNTMAAQGNEQIARANLIDLSRTVVSEVTQATVDLATANQRLETAEAQVANARELVRISEGRYSGGLGTFLEVSDAQSSLYSAQRNLTQAQADVRRATASLNHALGMVVVP